MSGFRRLTKNRRGLCFLVCGLLSIAAEAPTAAGEVLDLNAVSAAELEALPGLGRHRAGLIVRVRRRNGPFRSLSELRALPRLTRKMIDSLRPYLMVDSETPSEHNPPETENRHPRTGRSSR